MNRMTLAACAHIRRSPDTSQLTVHAERTAGPNSDPTLAVLVNCTPSGGDTAWMLTSVALVLMNDPSRSGPVLRRDGAQKNVGDTVMTSFAITCLVSIFG